MPSMTEVTVCRRQWCWLRRVGECQFSLVREGMPAGSIMESADHHGVRRASWLHLCAESKLADQERVECCRCSSSERSAGILRESVLGGWWEMPSYRGIIFFLPYSPCLPVPSMQSPHCRGTLPQNVPDVRIDCHVPLWYLKNYLEARMPQYIAALVKCALLPSAASTSPLQCAGEPRTLPVLWEI